MPGTERVLPFDGVRRQVLRDPTGAAWTVRIGPGRSLEQVIGPFVWGVRPTWRAAAPWVRRALGRAVTWEVRVNPGVVDGSGRGEPATLVEALPDEATAVSRAAEVAAAVVRGAFGR